MLNRFLKLVFKLPLPILHGLGAGLGWLMLLVDKKFAQRISQHLSLTKLATTASANKKLTRLTAYEIGKGILEALAIWLNPQNKTVKWVKGCTGWQDVQSAINSKKGIIFLTPHLGCFEITAQFLGAQMPLTVLFRPPRIQWLHAIMVRGRAQGQITLAETNMRGVRSLMKTLRNGEAIGVLPDQVPTLGEGEWANFFGQPVYTMTLVTKLAQTTGASVILIFGERLPRGRGYHLHFKSLGADTSPQGINDGIEKLVKTRPEQYLWSYQRFKQPK